MHSLSVEAVIVAFLFLASVSLFVFILLSPSLSFSVYPASSPPFYTCVVYDYYKLTSLAIM